jgi:hypothetical protein
MKKLLLVVLTIVLSYSAQATHLMGGQMTSRNIGGLTYEVTLTLYRDTVGIPMYNNAAINYTDTSGFDSTRIVSVSAPFNIGNGVERYTYTDTITFPAAGNYSISWSDCCRNAAILNMTMPGGESLYLNNTLFADSTNSSPVFLNEPITLAQLNTPFLYNPLPFDADGDSISWALDIPLSNLGDTVAGYTLPPSDSSMPFTMDAVTGEISFLPNTLGNFVVSVIVTEYRNGLVIGTIRRDMQLIVVNSPNTPAVFTSNYSVTRSSSAAQEINLAPGQNLNFSAFVNDVDQNNVSVQVAGSIFQRPTPPTVSVSGGIANGYVSLNWTAQTADVSTRPYLLTIRVGDNYGNYTFYHDYSFVVKVGSSTGINETNSVASDLKVFPNPTYGETFIQFDAKKAGTATIEVQNLSGQLVSQTQNDVVNGANMLMIDSKSFTKGIYLVKVMLDGQQVGVSKLSVK